MTSAKHAVLIIDDDVEYRTSIQQNLADDFIILTAPDGDAGMHVLADNKIDCVLLDVRIPGKDGVEILKDIRRLYPQLPVILVTGFGNEEIARHAIRYGAVGIINKPFHIYDLITDICNAINNCSRSGIGDMPAELLLVDDEEDLLDSLTDFLTDLPYIVRTATTGKQALSILQAHKIDIIITDVRMPSMSGMELLAKAKECQADCLPIVITGHGDYEIAIESLKRGAISYLRKPIDLEELRIAIEHGLNKLRLLQEYRVTNQRLKLEQKIVKATQEQSERQAQLVHASRLSTLGEMATGIAHELNQPLAGISLSVNYFKKALSMNRLTTAYLSKGIDDINQCVKRMSAIINHIRTFARQDDTTFIPTDIHETIEGALTLLGEQMRLHEIEVILDFDQTLPSIAANMSQLEQVWINHITNARDSLDEKAKSLPNFQKKLTITTKHRAADNVIDVMLADNGLGMSENVMKKIFDPFFTTKEVGKGTGLGLSVSHGIISNHNGTFQVESHEGLGAAITVSLPITRAIDDDDDNDDDDDDDTFGIAHP